MRSDLTLFVLAIVAIVGTFVLLVTGKPVPDLVGTLDTVLIGAAAGLSLPTKSAAADTRSNV